MKSMFLQVFVEKIEKAMQKEMSKSCFGIQNGDMALPSLTYPLIFDVSMRSQNIIFLLKPSRWANKSKKSSRGAPKGRQSAFEYSETPSFWAGGVSISN